MKKLFFITLPLILVLCSVMRISAFAPEIDAYEYFRAQLNPDEKTVYDTILKALRDDNTDSIYLNNLELPYVLTGLESQLKSLDGDYDNNAIFDFFEYDETFVGYMQNALDALTADHPEYFWIKVTSTVPLVGFTVKSAIAGPYLTLSYGIRIGKKQYDEEYVYNEIIKKVLQITDKNESRYNKLKKIHDFICENAVYEENEDGFSAMGALQRGRAVCQGYSMAFKLACDYYQIPCVCVSGTGITASTSGPHMWNYVQLNDGNWYGVDITWDDGNNISYDYFLCGLNNDGDKVGFSKTHIEEGIQTDQSTRSFYYPKISEKAFRYDPNTVADSQFEDDIVSFWASDNTPTPEPTATAEVIIESADETPITEPKEVNQTLIVSIAATVILGVITEIVYLSKKK